MFENKAREDIRILVSLRNHLHLHSLICCRWKFREEKRRSDLPQDWMRSWWNVVAISGALLSVEGDASPPGSIASNAIFTRQSPPPPISSMRFLYFPAVRMFRNMFVNNRFSQHFTLVCGPCYDSRYRYVCSSVRTQTGTRYAQGTNVSRYVCSLVRT